MPLSNAFWMGYAEPVSAFPEAATLFAETLQNLDAEVPPGDDNEEGAAEHRRREATGRCSASWRAARPR